MNSCQSCQEPKIFYPANTTEAKASQGVVQHRFMSSYHSINANSGALNTSGSTSTLAPSRAHQVAPVRPWFRAWFEEARVRQGDCRSQHSSPSDIASCATGAISSGWSNEGYGAEHPSMDSLGESRSFSAVPDCVTVTRIGIESCRCSSR